MKMPTVIQNSMFAPCGMTCAVCYKHVGNHKHAKPCAGCLESDVGKPEHCRTCKIKSCSQEKGVTRCFECGEFPCRLIKNLEKSYIKRYNVSLIENSHIAKEHGIQEFWETDRLKWVCEDCGGVYSLHDGVCSECGNAESHVKKTE